MLHVVYLITTGLWKVKHLHSPIFMTFVSDGSALSNNNFVKRDIWGSHRFCYADCRFTQFDTTEAGRNEWAVNRK